MHNDVASLKSLVVSTALGDITPQSDRGDPARVLVAVVLEPGFSLRRFPHGKTDGMTQFEEAQSDG
jgi:hypothetical protein